MKTLFVLLGPTGVGKTELSLQIAEFLHIPILNADSRQLYRDLPIGTAAPTAEAAERVAAIREVAAVVAAAAAPLKKAIYTE